VLRLILGQGLQLVGAGLAIGFTASLVMGRVLSRFLPLVDATDWRAFGYVAAALAALAISACYMPARRATRVPVTIALRHE
jgi:putative ABC transport system permease protein